MITTSYPRAPGDPAGGFVAGLSEHLRGRGHELTVLCAGDGGAAGDAASVHRIASSLFYQGGAPDALAARPLRGLLEAARFSALLLSAARRRLGGCDLLLSHWVLPCGLLGALCAAGRPHVCVAHSSDIHLLRRHRAEAAVRWLARRADLVYTDGSLRVPGAPGRVAPMGIFTREFMPRSPGERAAARARLGLRRTTALVLGRLVPVKGVDVLLAALSSGDLPLDLLIAGDGPERQRLARLAAPLGDRVRFLGEVRGPARRELLLGCDLLVLPSLRLQDGRTEGAPTVVPEALAACCPIVASAVGGTAALVGEAGLVVPPGRPEALGAALRRALDPAWREAARARARAQAPRHDWSVVGPAVLPGVQDVLSPPGAFVAREGHPG